jgi:hypothetical protein
MPWMLSGYFLPFCTISGRVHIYRGLWGMLWHFKETDISNRHIV